MSGINRQILITSIILVATILLLEISGLDIAVQDFFYNPYDKVWVIDRNNIYSNIIFYSGIKIVFYIFVILLIIALTIFHKNKTVQAYKPGLLIVLISTLLVPMVVGGLKSFTNIPCPKNIIHYGGVYPHVTVLKGFPKDYQRHENIKCFPAAHASGGFSLLSLFFLFKKKRNKKIAIYSALSIGWLTGLYKMLIGDHFLSHTVVSMILAWLLILLVYKFVSRFFASEKLLEE